MLISSFTKRRTLVGSRNNRWSGNSCFINASLNASHYLTSRSRPSVSSLILHGSEGDLCWFFEDQGAYLLFGSGLFRTAILCQSELDNILEVVQEDVIIKLFSNCKREEFYYLDTLLIDLDSSCPLPPGSIKEQRNKSSSLNKCFKDGVIIKVLQDSSEQYLSEQSNRCTDIDGVFYLAEGEEVIEEV